MGNSQDHRSKLTINTLTWLKFSFNLFDYESTEYSIINLKVQGDGFLVRRGCQIDFTPSPKELDQVLLRAFLGKEGRYIIERPIQDKEGFDIWRVSKPEQQVMVNQNDTLRIGRVVLRIKKLDLSTFPQVRGAIQLCGKAGPGNQCRFCFTQQNQITNPLLSSCECKGSLQYIHLQCLRTWLKTRAHKKQYDTTLCYSWENLKCELCSSYIKSDVDLFTLEQTDQPSIVIQTVQEFQQDRKVSLFVLGLDKASEIGIGRGKNNSIRINDISVSRDHCKLFLRDGHAFVRDTGSKFGTLVRLQRGVQINHKEEVWIQSARTLIKLGTFPLGN